MAIAQALFYFRDWERYPSGRLFERITQKSPAGDCAAIAKTTDGQGFIEYALTYFKSPTEKLVEYRGSSFGRQECSGSDFDGLRREMTSAIQSLA